MKIDKIKLTLLEDNSYYSFEGGKGRGEYVEIVFHKDTDQLIYCDYGIRLRPDAAEQPLMPIELKTFKEGLDLIEKI